MKKLYAKANEKLVKAVVLYPNESNVLCFDSAATDKVPAAMLKNLFEKGLVLVQAEGGEYKPTTFVDKTTYYEVSLVVMDTSAAETLAFKSDAISE